MQTTRAHLRTISWVDKDNFDPGLLCFVCDKLAKLVKAPIVNNFRFACLTNTGQILKHDPLVIGLRVSNDLLADLMVNV
jgi:hypothetical protein